MRPEFAAMSSLRDGGGERANIPQTIIDDAGRIGERKRGSISETAPAKNGRVSSNPPLMIEPVSASQAMGQEVQNIAGKPNLTNQPLPDTSSPPPAARTPPAPAEVAIPAAASSLYQPLASATPAPPPTVQPAPPPAPQPAEVNPAPPVPPEQTSEPFSRGTKRPGVPSFISGTRRR